MAVINIDRLTVAAGGVHTFDVAHTWNILNFTTGDIGSGATLQSSVPGTQVAVNFPAGTNTLGNVNGIDIDSSGGGAVVMSGTVDNCENWTTGVFGIVTCNVSSGWAGRTISINNTGFGFYGEMTVKIGGQSGTSAEKIEIDTSYGNGQQRLTCRVPFLSKGTYELYISNPDEEDTTISNFEIIKNFTWNAIMP